MDGSNIIALLIRSSDLGPQLLAAFFSRFEQKGSQQKIMRIILTQNRPKMMRLSLGSKSQCLKTHRKCLISKSK